MTSPDQDPSIEHEPHRRGDAEIDPSEQTARPVRPPASEMYEERALHSVWDERHSPTNWSSRINTIA